MTPEVGSSSPAKQASGRSNSARGLGQRLSPRSQQEDPRVTVDARAIPVHRIWQSHATRLSQSRGQDPVEHRAVATVHAPPRVSHKPRTCSRRQHRRGREATAAGAGPKPSRRRGGKVWAELAIALTECSTEWRRQAAQWRPPWASHQVQFIFRGKVLHQNVTSARTAEKYVGVIGMKAAGAEQCAAVPGRSCSPNPTVSRRTPRFTACSGDHSKALGGFEPGGWGSDRRHSSRRIVAQARSQPQWRPASSGDCRP